MIELPPDSDAGWRMTGRGGFRAIAGALEREGGPGLLWRPAQSFANFRLRVGVDGDVVAEAGLNAR